MLLKQRFEYPDFWGLVSAMLSCVFLSSLQSTSALSVNLNSASHPQAKLWGWWCSRQSYSTQHQNYWLLTPKQGFDFWWWNYFSRRMQTKPSCLPHLLYLGHRNPVTINWGRKCKCGSTFLSIKNHMIQLCFTYRIPSKRRLCSQLTLRVLLRALQILRVTSLQDTVWRNAGSSQRKCNTIQVTTQTKAQLIQVLVRHQ